MHSKKILVWGGVLRTIRIHWRRSLEICLLLWAALALLPSHAAETAYRIEVTRCASIFSRLLTVGRTPLVYRIPFNPASVDESLPDDLPVHLPKSGLGRFVYRHIPPFGESASPGASVAITSPSSLKQLLEPGRWYAFVVTRDGLKLTRSSYSKLGDLAAKHVRLAQNGVRFAGMLAFDGEGTVYVSNDSGTFQPPTFTLPGIQKLLESELPGIKVRTIDEASVDIPKLINESDDHSYHQPTPALFDPEGDVRQLRQLGRLMRLFLPKHRKKFDEDYRSMMKDRHGMEPAHSRGYKIGNEYAVNVTRLLNVFHRTMLLHPEITPHIGPEPQWTKPVYRFLQPRMLGLPVPPKLFMAMVVGRSSDFTTTGLEPQLEQKLLTYADGSVQIDDVLNEAYVLANGDVTKALLTAENVLSKDSGNPNRDHTPLTRKLAYIRSDSAPEGDNYGAWYHMFGMALLALHQNSVSTYFVGEAESLLSRGTSPHDRQEELFNRIGASLGIGIRKMINKGTYQAPLRPFDRFDYMNRREFPQSTSTSSP